MASSVRATNGGVDLALEELTGSPTASFGRQSRTIKRELKLPWVNIDALIAECYPNAASPGAYPGLSYLSVDTLDIKPFHPDPGDEVTISSGVAIYELAHASISYSILEYDSSDLLSRTFSIGGEVMTYPSKSLRWKGDTTILKGDSIAGGKIIPMIQHSITKHKVAGGSIPYSTMRSLIGHINSSAFDTGAANAAIGTVLYMGTEINFTFRSDGQKEYSLTNSFQERLAKQGAQSVGWNYFWRDDAWPGAAWEEIETTKGEPIYPSGNLNSLL